MKLQRVYSWLLPPKAQRSESVLVGRFAVLLLGCGLLSVGAEVLVRLELQSPGLHYFVPARAQSLFTLRSVLWPLTVLFAPALVGGYAVLASSPPVKRQPPTLLPYIAWIAMTLGSLALLGSVVLDALAPYALELGLYHVSLGCFLLGAMVSTAALTKGLVKASDVGWIERWCAGPACVVAVLAAGAVAWHGLHQAGPLASQLLLFEHLTGARYLLFALIGLGVFGALLTVRRSATWHARLFALASLYLGLTGFKLLGLLATSDSDIYLHDTYAVLAATYACTSSALLGLFCVHCPRGAFATVLGWVASALLLVGSLWAFPIMLELGKAGMPLNYIDYSSEFASMQSELTWAFSVFLLGMAIALLAMLRACLHRGRPGQPWR